MANWTKGIPPVEMVAEHERLHCGPGRADGIRLRRINISRTDKPGGVETPVEKEDSYGIWIAIDRFATFRPGVPSMIRLRVVNSEILMANGFCFWQPLAECNWADRAQYFPVSTNGLPVDYEVKDV